jgi:hypothetical protein
VLASFSLTVLFIAKAGPRAAGEIMTVTTWSRRPADMCVIKDDDFISLSRDPFVAAESHGYSNPLDSRVVFGSLGGKRTSDHF